MSGLEHISGGDGISPKRRRTQKSSWPGSQSPVAEEGRELAEDDPQGNDAPGLQDSAEAGTGPQPAEDFESMTETVKTGLFMIQSRTEAADAKVRTQLACTLHLHTMLPVRSHCLCCNCCTCKSLHL